jgi:hypothetical protein
MRIAVLVAFNQITLKNEPIASGDPMSMKNLAKEYSLGIKKIEGYNQVKYFEQTYRTWKISKKAEVEVEVKKPKKNKTK